MNERKEGRGLGTRPQDRVRRLTALHQFKMARDPHAYVRGSTVKFYEWLEETCSGIPKGPPIWICGDCHLGNLGPLADEKDRVAVQIRDFDQTVIGNPAQDIIRLGLSLACAARGSDLSGVTIAKMLEELMAGYRRGLAHTPDKGHSTIVQKLLAQSLRRRWRNLALDRLNGAQATLPLGRSFWPLTSKERAELSELLDQQAVRAMITALRGRDTSDRVRMIDAAYWVKGCSSLGRLRYAALMAIGKGKGSELCLVDVKEAVRAAAPCAPGSSMPRENALRVVTGAQALSPNLGDRMVAGRLRGASVFLRELTPHDLKIEVGRLTPGEATALAGYLADVLGRAHARQMDKPTRDSWRAALARPPTSALRPPSWLWSAVVELLSIHELSYLDHCRTVALCSGPGVDKA